VRKGLACSPVIAKVLASNEQIAMKRMKRTIAIKKLRFDTNSKTGRRGHVRILAKIMNAKTLAISHQVTVIILSYCPSGILSFVIMTIQARVGSRGKALIHRCDGLVNFAGLRREV
jgi:hypothetical protein